MKRTLSLIMVLVMVLSMVPVFYAEAAESVIITSGTDVAASVAEPVIYTWTAETNGTLTVTMGVASPGWKYTILDAEGNTVGLPKTGKTEKSADFTLTAGTQYTFQATGYNTSTWDEVSANITYTLSFLPDEETGEIVKSDYEVSKTALVLGDNSLTLLETAITTIYVFEPTETGVFTFTAPAGAILGYWGAGSWFLNDPNSTTNTYEWTCTGVGQSAYIGVSGIEGTFNLNVEKTGDYTVIEIPTIVYENKADLKTFTLPAGYQMHGYIDVNAETTHTAVLGDDGYYHFNSADGDIILVDMNYQDIILSNALLSDRPVMYAYVTDEDGNQVKYDIGAAVKEYEAVMDENGYYPLTEDLIIFYDAYAKGSGVYSYYVTGTYNEDNIWMYCMRTVTLPEVTEPEETEPEGTEPEVTEPEGTEPEVTEPEATDPEVTEPEPSVPEASEPSEPADPNALISVIDEAVTVEGYVFEYTAASAGTLHVSAGDCSPGWRYKVFSPDGVESGYRSKYTAGTECDYHNIAGKWKIVFYAYSSLEADNVAGTVSFTITFTPDKISGGETEKDPYKVSATELTVGNNALTLLDTAVTTIFKFKPTAIGTYAFTAPEGAIVGNWGSNVSYLKDPNSTTNLCEWTCTGVGQSAYIGVTGVDGSFVLNVILNESTGPDETEPEATEPEVTEPEPTEPEVTEPAVTEPVIDNNVPSGTVFAVYAADGTVTYYSTASQIITVFKNMASGTLKLYQDVALGNNKCLEIYNGTVTLDLNGCTVTNSYSGVGALYVDGANITVMDSSAAGDGLLQNTHASGYGIQIWTGTCNLVSGNVDAISNGLRVENTGTLNMSGGQVTAQKYGINVTSTATADISGGIITQTVAGTFNRTMQAASTASVTVTGGYFNGGAVSGSSLVGKISGGYFSASFSSNYLASGCELQDNDDAVYMYKVIDPNAEPEEPDVTEPTEPIEPSEPETEPTEPTEPSEPETEPTVPSEPETEPSEPSESGDLFNLVNETVTASGYVFEYTAATAGTLNVTVGTCSPGWRYKIFFPDGTESIYRTKWSAGESCDYEGDAGNWKIVFYAYSSAEADNVDGTVSFTVSFTPKEGGSGEVEKAEYEIADTALVLGDNSVSLLETAITTIYVFEPTETGIYTFTAPAGAILGYWGAGSWFLSNPNSTTNTYEWTCTGVGQSAYIGVSGADGTFNLNVEKTGDYTVVEIPTVLYENKAPLSTFTLPEGTILGSYIDVTAETAYQAVLGADGYFHLNSANGPIILVDMNYMDIVLSAALNSDRPVMYAYVTDENGNTVKYDIGEAVKAYEAVMDENGYYPLTEDLILFYDTYAVGSGVYSYYVTTNYNEENIWMYCMRTATFPVIPENPVNSWNVDLSDNLKVNFYLNINDPTTEQVRITVGETVVTYNVAGLENADGKYVASVCIAAAQMTDIITVEILGSDGNYETKSYTIRQYADTVLADSSLSEYHALIKEMLNYGAAAQSYFEYNADTLANDGITDVAAEDVPETADELIVDGKANSAVFYGASLVYQNKIAVRFYFKGDVSGCTFTVNGIALTAEEKDGMYYVEIADILPQDLDQQITVTVTDAEGNTLTVTYGPMNYIVRMNAKGSDSVKTLMKALYNYHLAAKQLRAN